MDPAPSLPEPAAGPPNGVGRGLCDEIEAATERELVEQDWLRQTEDFREGIKAYAERRLPDSSADLIALHARFPDRYPVVLESAALGAKTGRYALLLAGPGLTLVFRSQLVWPVLLGALLFVANRIAREEALLASHFGSRFRGYRARTWALVPLLY